MPWFVSDRVLWATILVAAGVAYFYVPATFDHFAAITEVPEAPESGPNKQLQKDAEKALSHETLRTLSEGYSHNIRAATIKVVANRAIKSRTKYLLLQDLASKSESRRSSAICAIKLLFYNQAISDKNHANSFTDLPSLKAIVTALENVLELHEASPEAGSMPLFGTISPILLPHRSAHEQSLLVLLHDILNASHPDPLLSRSDIFETAVQAGLITRWLNKYPFPCTLPANSQLGFQKSDIGKLFASQRWASHDPPMAMIFQDIMNYDRGREQLRSVGLASNVDVLNTNRYVEIDRLIDDVRMVNGESTAGALTPPELRELLNTTRDEHRRRRSLEFSQEEENLRRRHREAIVLAEAGAPLRRENILQRRVDTNMLSGIEIQEDSSTWTRAGDATDIIQEEDSLQDLDSFARSEVPWDPRRQEIEGEAMVNGSIRGNAQENFLTRILHQARRHSIDEPSERGSHGTHGD